MESLDNNSTEASGADRDGEGSNFETLFSSRQWSGYFDQLAKTLDIELSGYSEGLGIFITNENPVCRFLRSLPADIVFCPESCEKEAASGEYHVFKCQAGMVCFSVPVEVLGEKVCLLGRGSFADPAGLLKLLKTLRNHNLPELPVTMPLRFTRESDAEAAARYLSVSVTRQLKTIEEKNILEEKYLRLSSLFDSQAFGTLSRKPELLYRYILDTIEFVFGRLRAVLLSLDEENLVYRAVHSTGPHRDRLITLSIGSDSPLIMKLKDRGSPVFFDDLKGSVQTDGAEGFASAHFFPLFRGGTMTAAIGIFDDDLSREDVKVLNAFREYVQIHLENRELRLQAGRDRKAEERLSYLSGITKSIISILDKETLLNTLLDKSLQLVGAEQGSLMLLDRETEELVVEARKSVDDMVKEKMRIKKEEGISGMVLNMGGSLLVEDIEKDPRFRKLNRSRYRTKSFVSVPIKINDRLSGLLNASDKIRGDAFDKEDVNKIESFLSNVAIAIERSLLYSQAEQLQRLTITDPLTGIYNRRYLNRRLSEEITRYNRYQHPFSFMMLDLDKFKDYNDTFGHVAGDNLIKDLAAIINKSLRTVDIAARFGGDEFVAILPQTPKVDAIQISNRLKEHIEQAMLEYNKEMNVTISMGLATFPDDASSIMELIEKTDQALYLAKKGGGNRVVYL